MDEARSNFSSFYSFFFLLLGASLNFELSWRAYWGWDGRYKSYRVVRSVFWVFQFKVPEVGLYLGGAGLPESNVWVYFPWFIHVHLLYGICIWKGS